MKKYLHHVKKYLHSAKNHLHKVKQVPSFLKEFKKKIRKVHVFSLAGLFVLMGLLSVAYLVIRSPLISTERKYSLELYRSKITKEYFAKNKKITFNTTLSTIEPRGLGIFSEITPVVVKMDIDKKTIFEKEILFDKENKEAISWDIPVDTSEYKDGSYPVVLTLSDKTNLKKVFKKINVSLVVDGTVPELQKVTGEKANISRYTVLSNDKTATPPANMGINVYSNTKGPISLKLLFSEKGTLKAQITESMADAQLEETGTSEAKIVFTAKQNEWKAPFIFEDMAENSIKGEIHYVYDAVVPKINVVNDHRVPESMKGNYSFVFSASEPLAFARVNVNGKIIYATGDYRGYRVGGIQLNDDKTTITVEGQDLAGNFASAQVNVTIYKPQTYSFNFGSTFKRCTEDDWNACEVEDLYSCEAQKRYHECIAKRCDNKIRFSHCE